MPRGRDRDSGTPSRGRGRDIETETETETKTETRRTPGRGFNAKLFAKCACVCTRRPGRASKLS